MDNINKVLFITLSNIGDVILTLPVLDSLRSKFPQSRITVMVGPRPKEIFEDNPYIDRLIIYDKHSRLTEKINLFQELRKEKFDLVVDLRNSLFGALLPVRYKTSPFLMMPKNIRHMKDRHLFKIQNLISKMQGSNIKENLKSLYIKPQDEEYINKILKENNIKEREKIIVISPGARSETKRWFKERFVGLISSFEDKFIGRVVLVGDKDDIATAEYLSQHLSIPIIDLTAKTSISQLACLLKRAELLITNDSAVLHLASYLDTKVIAIFGPTDESKYGPWGRTCSIVKKDIFCRPCQRAQCKFRTWECMSLIKVTELLTAVKGMLTNHRSAAADKKDAFKRIIIVRTDRIGDVLLSTPAIKAVRDVFPNAYIEMMVNPYAREIVEDNPYLDKTIIYDKDLRHKSWLRSMFFAWNLRKKRFDLAIVLHPTNRVHLITYFAGIPKRVGFNRKLGFLLTDRIEHRKQLGKKHELEYTLDLVRYLGIEPKDKNLFMPIKAESERWVEDIFRQEGIKHTDKLLAIHPSASCLSKIWPVERLAEVADRLTEKYAFKVLIVCAAKDLNLAEDMLKHIYHPRPINLGGKTSVSQLASLLKRCRLFISNDSGPVHIASAVGTPVISIFGRNQRGLSPQRWHPRGEKDKVLHKEVGCIECLAHNCKKDFLCLKAITVDDVIEAAESILRV